MASPLERSKALLESNGFHVWKVERPATMWAPTLDLFNCIDLVAIREDRSGVVGIQCCGEDIQPHVHKILEGYEKKSIKKGEMVVEIIPPNPYLKTWLKAGNLFFIWGWRLRKNEGTRAKYQLREIEFVVKDGIVVAQELPKSWNMEVQKPMHGPEEEAALQKEADAALEMAREARDAKYRAQEAEQNECPECNS